MEWIIENKEWIFSGLGIFLITLVINFFSKKKKNAKQIQKGGKGSKNYQAGGDININDKKND